MSKPIVIAAGLFPDRHRQLVSHLSSQFEVVMYHPTGTWDGYRHLTSAPRTAYGDEAGQIHKISLELSERLGIPLEAFSEATARFVGGYWGELRGARTTFQQLAQEQTIAAVLLAIDYLAPFRILVRVAEELRIPTIFIGHGSYNALFLPSAYRHPNLDALLAPVCQYICLEDEQERQYFLDAYKHAGRPIPEMRVTGKPYDFRQDVKLEKAARRDDSPTVLLYGPAWVEANSVLTTLKGELREHVNFTRFCELASRLKQRFPSREFRHVVKLHPTLARNLETDTSSYFHRIAAKYGIKVETDASPIDYWLPRVDLTVAYPASSICWESFLHGVPVLSFMPEDLRPHLEPTAWSSATRLAQWGAQRLVDTMDDAVDEASDLLQMKWNSSFATLPQRRLSQEERFSAAEACENVVSLVNELLDERKQAESMSSSRKLRILQVVHNFPPQSFAGTELYTLNLSHELIALGHDVTVLYPVMRPDKAPLSFERTEYEGIPIIQFNAVVGGQVATSDFVSPAFDLPFQALLRQEEFDVIHFQHIYHLSGSWLSIAKASGAAVLMKLDDLFYYCPQIHLNHSNGSYCEKGPESLDKCYACLFPNGAGPEPNKVAAAYHHLAYRRAYLQSVFPLPDAIHTPSRFVKETHAAFGFHHPDFRVIPTGIKPFERLPKSPDPQGKLRIAFLGTLAKRKGIMDFLEAIRRYHGELDSQSLSFHIYGRHFNDAIYEDVSRMSREMSGVSYHGAFTPSDLPRILAEVDLVVVPSIGENYPFIIREALFADVPVIATRIAAVPEIIEHGTNGYLYAPGNAKELAALFVALARDPRQALSLRPAPERVKLAEQEAREIESLYRELLARKEDRARRDVKVSIVIPLCNNVDDTERCLSSLVAHTPEDLYEVILVDNASTDGTKDLLAQLDGDVTVVSNAAQVGLAKAFNQGAEVAGGRYILFLGNDTEAQPGWLEPLMKVLDDERDVGVVGSRLLYSDSTLEHAGVMVAESQRQPLLMMHRFHRRPADYPAANVRTDLQAVTGAAMFVRAEAFHSVGGFDESYWNGYEDLDLCFTLQAEGWRVVFEPQSCLIHHESDRGPAYLSENPENEARLHQKWLGKLIPDHMVEASGLVKRHPSALRTAARKQLPDGREVNVLTFFQDPGFDSALLAYLEAFTEGEAVVMHVLCPSASESESRVLQLLADRGLHEAQIPDISLIEFPLFTIDQVMPFLWAVDLVISADLGIQAAAEAVGIPCEAHLESRVLSEMLSRTSVR